MEDLASVSAKVRGTIRDIPDFPKPGIMFKDITPILQDARLMREITGYFANLYGERKIDAVVGMESRGFIFGTPLAMALGCAFVPARKPGKLPYERVSESYALEYGHATLDMHVDALSKGHRVLIMDDLLATGGTAAATARLVQKLGAEVVGFAFVVELDFLGGRANLGGLPVDSIVHY
ncbi:MAG TPA: adenine phosphoribosyltransferase [Myxococcota bacterium]|nr:adenine phosphoribosyltransferase [Myxococcota bacterium]HND28794.1 adenine phosphoribosyltransferase [Myxococcota bacterium]